MHRYKLHKQAFIMTAMVILLCIICLSGATLALFTSDPNDGTIGIITTAGDVKVDIVDAGDETSSLVDQSLAFITSSDNKDVIFEPGATFYTQSFKVKNTGDIPINFSLSVSKDEKINSEEFDKAFEVWIVRENDDFENAEHLTKFKGRLEVGESSEAYCLFVKMKETAGDEFQNKSYTGIGVTVFAVQGNVDIKE